MLNVILAVIIIGIYRRLWEADLWKYRLGVDLMIFQALVGVLAHISKTVYDHGTVLSVLGWFVLPWGIAIAYYERKHRLLATT